MKYFSEKTGAIYDSIKDLQVAEAEVLKKEAEAKAKESKRAERAKEVEKAFEKAEQAKKEANELLEKFLDDYGKFHMSFKNESPSFSLFDFDWFL